MTSNADDHDLSTLAPTLMTTTTPTWNDDNTTNTNTSDTILPDLFDPQEWIHPGIGQAQHQHQQQTQHQQQNMAVVSILIALIAMLCLILMFVTIPPLIHMIKRRMPVPQAKIDRRYATIDGWLITKVRTL